MKTSICCLWLFLSILLFAHSGAEQNPDWFVQHALQKPAFPDLVQQYELQQCLSREKVQHAELNECNDHIGALQSQLRDRTNAESLTGIFIAAVGIGIGIGAFIRLALFLKRLKLPGVRKQLLTAIVCSFWIIAAAFILASDASLNTHPVSLLVMILIYSLPAILFGGIILWWLARTNAGVPRLW